MAKDSILTDAQKEILGKVISKTNSSTFVMCANEEQEAALANWQNVKKQLKGRQISPEQEKELEETKEKIKNIFSTSVYCPYCGKLANVEGEVNPYGSDALQFSCECEGSKKEFEEKARIAGMRAELDEQFYDIQVASTNAAIKTYKEHYKDIIEFRKKAFEKLDNDILNAPEL